MIRLIYMHLTDENTLGDRSGATKLTIPFIADLQCYTAKLEQHQNLRPLRNGGVPRASDPRSHCKKKTSRMTHLPYN